MDSDTIRGLAERAPPRAPFIPVLGEFACAVGQVEPDVFGSDPQVQAATVAQVGSAVSADALVVGVLGDVGVDAVGRLRALVPATAIAGWVEAGDVATTRAYCEAGADLLFIHGEHKKLKTQGKACAFYGIPTVLVGDAALAEEHGLTGAVVEEATGDEPGLLGVPPGDPPRGDRFFWTFTAPVGADQDIDQLAALGRRLTT